MRDQMRRTRRIRRGSAESGDTRYILIMSYVRSLSCAVALSIIIVINDE